MTETTIPAQSVCPVCLKSIPARKVEDNGSIYLEKTCSEHGFFKTMIWRQNARHYRDWSKGSIRGSGAVQNFQAIDKGCPNDCGLCAEHKTRACTMVLEVTHRCNLTCPVCFADAGGRQQPGPTIETIRGMYEATVKAAGYPTIQLSGGEPTLRDDLPQIAALGREMGFNHILINTNGIRIAEEIDYLQRLKDSGAGTIYLQFDGLSDDIYQKIRGQNLLELKKRAIANCTLVKIGVVLVPTIVPGINDNQMGDIVKFAKEWIPTVKGVHFQPVSYFGRYPHPPADKDRMTIPDVISALETQTHGEIKADNFIPRQVEDSHCDFAGSFVLNGEGTLEALNSNAARDTANASHAEAVPEEGTRKFMARHWQYNECCQTGDRNDFLDQLLQYNLSISCMPFQDAWNLDMDRLKACCIQVVTVDQRIIPFCAYYLTGANGQRLYPGT
jgi:7,8-dihydro-6-hydroxymethylpterin dimethyltransferase